MLRDVSQRGHPRAINLTVLSTEELQFSPTVNTNKNIENMAIIKKMFYLQLAFEKPVALCNLERLSAHIGSLTDSTCTTKMPVFVFRSKCLPRGHVRT